MNYTNLFTLLDGNILIITINREQRLNALNKQTIIELEDVIKNAQTQADIRAIIITGAGNKAFVSGADIKEFIGLSDSEGRALATFGQNAFNSIETSIKPILAAVNGYALGGGCELAMACHLRIASDNAIFGQPEVKLGIIAGYGGTQRLIHYIGKAKAMELHMTGRNINSAEALYLGLVNYVVPQSQLLNKSKELLNEIIINSPKSIEGIIKSINSYFESNNSGFNNEIEEFGKCFLTNDSKEGVSAFLEKRKPNFTGN
ncbi:MAG: enoyl-CoA hydratase/isomerase family protein [Bacteroidetes bacterium]|nr:enoyl-CoA hydratase/isomerase family protein [Bacteroidota bacterium]